ncbi:hypothetical protein GCM10023085_50520 [Actinomadura viridis]|uniref:4Fe-4S Wbl-type domain-containing protein n=1 Tax=Actinomadura viridis TaxID=58110 RepID=A0A931DRB3_9ACTN|nr:WhiB family transcriptional regulator [Actinomadura viridis]MBG6092366.1 hypothetical protein [Actinomadura viridis]
MTIHPSKLSFVARKRYGLATAECAFDPELHTGPTDKNEGQEEKAARLAVAAEVCLACPVMTQCLDRAITGRPEPGVWGAFEAEALGALFVGALDVPARTGRVTVPSSGYRATTMAHRARSGGA